MNKIKYLINGFLKMFGYKMVRVIKEEEKKVSEESTDSKLSNVEYNKQMWDNYARHWEKGSVYLEDEEISEEEKGSYLDHLGDEWGTKEDVNEIIEKYIFPYITENSIVGEIGVGGGRVASKVINKVEHLYCFDVSTEMIKKTEIALQNTGFSNYSLIVLDSPKFPDTLSEKFDFIYSFDVFVHLDLHNIWHYFKEINRVLKCKGRAFLHTTNLGTPGGWDRFSKQDGASSICCWT